MFGWKKKKQFYKNQYARILKSVKRNYLLVQIRIKILNQGKKSCLEKILEVNGNSVNKGPK